MDPNETQPVNTQQPTAAPQQMAQASPTPQPIGQHPFWYIPGVTIFDAQKAIATLYPGLLVVTSGLDGQEMYRYNLVPDMKISAFGGYANIKFLNGNKIGSMDKKYRFFFYNPKMQLISFLFILSRMAVARSFVLDCKKAAGQIS